MPPKKDKKTKAKKAPKAPNSRVASLEKARKLWLAREEQDRDRYYAERQLEPEEETLEQRIRRQKKELAENRKP